MERIYWLRTSDPDLLVMVPHISGEPVVITLTDSDQVADYEPPAATAFDLACTLTEDALDEAREVAAEYNVTVNADRMAMTYGA